MYPSKESSSYGQQSYPGQRSYGQMPGTGSLQGQSAMTGMNQEASISGFRTHPSQEAQYSGPFAALYASAALSTAQQVVGRGIGVVQSGFQERMSHPSALPPEASNFSSGELGSNLGTKSDEFVSASNRGYAPKGGQFPAVKSSDYALTERTTYLGRELQSDPSRRYADSVPINQQHQADLHEHMVQASLFRQQQMLKAQALQARSDMRQTDYLAVRSAQEFSSCSGRKDVDPHNLYILGSTPYGAQHAASVTGGAPMRNVGDVTAQGSSSAAYGVGLPPGRDYVAGKGLHGPSLESDYQGNALLHGHPNFGVSMGDKRKDDRISYHPDLDLRDEQLRRELMRAREKDREREEHELQKEKDRQREKDREREERERKREKDRERDRLELREKERERDRKRRLESRWERTPSRSARDCRGSSSLKAERTPRRVSPRRISPCRDVVHRRYSPVKEKKREYICKVYPFCLVDAERDYLSLSKRYPKLSISPECSKVVLHWPKGSLHLSLNTPVSFEHEVVEVDAKDEKGPVLSDGLSGLASGSTVWNAKVILMSGISSDTLNDLSSCKTSDEKTVQHVNNILRFAILKKDNSFMAIGGPWNPTIDGGDPSVEESSLIQTARRYVRDTTQLDLHNCRQWNRFLEIHYDRVGSDGLFSHKEITVLFVPDLSECVPSLDSWRRQWFAYKKNVAERESKMSAKQEKKSTEKKDSLKEHVKVEEDARVDKTGTDDPILAKETDTKKDEGSKDTVKERTKHTVEQKGMIEKAAEGAPEKRKIDDEKVMEVAAVDPPVNIQKPGKKKVVKKVVKKPVAEMGNQDEKTMEKKETEDATFNQAAVVKTAGKKKIIRRVIKRKEAGPEVKDVTALKETTEEGANVAVQTENKGEIKEKIETDVSLVGNNAKIMEKPKKMAAEKESKAGERNKAEKESKKDGTSDNQNLKTQAANSKDTGKDGQDGKKRTKDEKDKDKKTKDAKHESETKSHMEVKGKPKDPPEYPGFFLQTKRSKAPKIRSMSLSLDGLLDYNDKDIEETIFELSVFAESINEMLQYQMGCCLLSFLEKLRRTFIISKNHRKRQRDVKSEKESEKESSSAKHAKVTDVSAVDNGKDTSDKKEHERMREDRSAAGQDESKTGNMLIDGSDDSDEAVDEYIEEEDPEEIIEDDQAMENASPPNGVHEQDDSVVKSAAESEKPTVEGKNGEKSADDKRSTKNTAVANDKSDEGKEADKRSETVKSDPEKEVVVVHQEALQAFRYFDRNRVGYIKVEDLRCILHNLGKFLSHRDVKEMVQSALIESNSPRDNRIFYKKLVKLTDI